MPHLHGSIVFALAALASVPASAEILTYRISNTSVLSGNLSVVGDMDMEPDLAEAFPTFLIATGTTNTRPRGTMVADVPLDQLTGNPIVFQSGEITFPALGRVSAGGLVTLPFPPLPGLPVGGTTVFAAAFDLGDLTFVFDPPFTTTDLYPSGDGEWTFAALATGVISGTVSPELSIPTMEPIAPLPVPIEPTAIVLPLVGTFSGGAAGTRIALGLDDATEPLTLDLAVETLDFTLSPLVAFHATLDSLSVADTNLYVEAKNARPLTGGQPSGPSCGLGAELPLLGIAWWWRRRKSTPLSA